MFLATTAIEDFWDRRDRLLFLGAWCVPWAKRERCMRPGDRILPSVWDDRARFYEAALYADACCERLLVRLSAHLDWLHREERGVAYWRVVVGPWLMNFVHASYDRSAHLEAALAQEPALETVVLDSASYLTPRTGPDALQWFLDDGYNLQLCSQLLDAMGRQFPARPRAVGSAVSATPLPRRPRLVARVEAAAALRLRGRVGLAGTSLSFAERVRIAAATRGTVLPVPGVDDAAFVGPAAEFDRRRQSLGDVEAVDAFERALVRMLPINFPTLYLEGHAAARAAARQILGRVPLDALVSETGWYASEGTKYVAAEARAAGTRLVAVQHGGGYGVYKFSPGELHERRLSDRYLVWGWADDERLRNWPSIAISRHGGASHDTPATADADGVLFVATTGTRYLHVFNSQPAGTQLEGYFAWQARFFAALPASLHRQVVVRPHRLDYGQAVWPRIAERFPGIARDHGRTFVSAIRRSGLVVIDHCATAMLEVFAANRPAVLFWDPARWELRPTVQPCFDELRGLGVLHDDPEQAAHHVQRVLHRAAAWWRSGDIQAARRRFVERFALHVRGGAVAWARALAQEIAST
jgi:putative transferase (TIGR04331 family)